jgi:hypothetical protein
LWTVQSIASRLWSILEETHYQLISPGIRKAGDYPNLQPIMDKAINWQLDQRAVCAPLTGDTSFSAGFCVMGSTAPQAPS